MGNVIKMDLYRLVKSLSFKICLGIVFLMSLLSGPIAKIGYNITKKLADSAESQADKDEILAELGEWEDKFHVGNIIAGQLGVICTAVFLLCIVYFCFSDIQHGYIKNIAGQLPSRGHTVISKFVVIEVTTFVFYGVEILGEIIGQLIIGRKAVFDLFYAAEIDAKTQEVETAEKVFSMGAAFGELAIKIVLLSSLCALILLLTTGIGSNVAGTIVAVLCGAGFSGLAYTGITAGLKKLFKFEDFALSDYMPDSLYRTNLNEEDCMVRALIVGVAAAIVLLYCTINLYNKKDIK